MDSYVTGTAIRQLREAKHLTQAELAEKLAVSAKAISKWETARGLPDISLLEPLAAALGVSVLELMRGEPVVNRNRSANLLRSKLYVCPLCGNVLHATGQAVVSCCGITLPPLDISEADDADEHHQLTLERVEDELFVTIHHPMTKDHYISFIACLTGDKLQLVKLYPEGDASCRFKITGAGVLYFYCNRHGLMKAPDFRAAARHTPSQKLHLREPDEGDREQVMAYREEFLAISSRLDGTSALDKYDDFGQWLANIHEHLVGMTNLRHHLNDYLLAYGGHIGYSVRPSERKNGYASQMLCMTLEKAKERGISKVRICCDHYNIASAKTIQSNGGVLEDEMFDSSDGMLTQRYWIENR
jgi:predicted acetyltransferase/transcriptional regulator with XRE-family HTH domain/desulfoferrodoxin (superoxide reductase-like protein)